MLLNKLLTECFLIEGEPSEQQVTVLPAGVAPGVEYTMVVAKEAFENLLVEFRATEPASEPVLMAIGQAKTLGDPVWKVLLAQDSIVDCYSTLSSKLLESKLDEYSKGDSEPVVVGPEFTRFADAVPSRSRFTTPFVPPAVEVNGIQDAESASADSFAVEANRKKEANESVPEGNVSTSEVPESDVMDGQCSVIESMSERPTDSAPGVPVSCADAPLFTTFIGNASLGMDSQVQDKTPTSAPPPGPFSVEEALHLVPPPKQTSDEEPKDDAPAAIEVDSVASPAVHEGFFNSLSELAEANNGAGAETVTFADSRSDGEPVVGEDSEMGESPVPEVFTPPPTDESVPPIFTPPSLEITEEPTPSCVVPVGSLFEGLPIGGLTNEVHPEPEVVEDDEEGSVAPADVMSSESSVVADEEPEQSSVFVAPVVPTAADTDESSENDEPSENRKDGDTAGDMDPAPAAKEVPSEPVDITDPAPMTEIPAGVVMVEEEIQEAIASALVVFQDAIDAFRGYDILEICAQGGVEYSSLVHSLEGLSPNVRSYIRYIGDKMPEPNVAIQELVSYLKLDVMVAINAGDMDLANKMLSPLVELIYEE